MQEVYGTAGSDSDACNRVSRWLEERPTMDGFYSLSSDRPFTHDENGYDSQYTIVADDIRWGEGLLNLLRQRGADMSSPCLEIGCGTGALTVGLAAAAEYPFVVATDMSSAFLHIVERKAHALSIPSDRLRLAIYDSDAPDAPQPPDAAFSLIALRAVLHHILKPEAFIHKMAALLKPGGVLVLHEPCREGMLLLGLLARMYEMFLIRASVRQKSSALVTGKLKIGITQRISQSMLYFARRDMDKSNMEDKHLFLPEEIMHWGQNAGLDVEFLPNREFSEFSQMDKQPGIFSVRHFISSYLQLCLSLDERFVKEFMRFASPYTQYVEQCSQGGSAPAFHGIFLLRKCM